MGRKQTQVICKNVFKGGKNTPVKDQFTKQWTDMIIRMEEDKRKHTGKTGQDV
ncbi:MAG: hypothetical protein SOY73_04645 [Blautia sp.]|nr:hypothetical protein [Blautia sp.]MDY3998380.1 hypothetical protein [Blautia sp.]